MKATSGLSNVYGGCAVQSQKLGIALKGYSTEAVKTAITQSTLNKEQINAILYQKGLTGEILETTTAELAQITTNNALTASQEAATASTLGLGNALKGLAKTHPIIVGLTATIGIVTAISTIYKKHQEKIAETLKKSTELTESYKQEQSNLDSIVKKYKDLNEQLTNASLSTEEYNSIKEQLSSLQDDLVAKYGEEASAIDIVNGKYDEQIKKLDTLSRQKAQDFVNESSSGIEEDWNFLNDTKSIVKQRRTTNGNAEIYNKYLQGLNGIDAIHDYNSNYSGDGVYLNYKYEGTPEEIRKQINADMNALRERYGNTNEYVNAVLKDLSELLKDEKVSSEQISQSKQNLLTFAQASIDSNYEIQSAYDSFVDGIEKYNNALETGDGVDKAYNNYEKLRNEFKNVSTDIIGIEYLYDDLLNKINEPLDLSYKLDTNIENGNENTERYLNKLQGVTSDQLRSLNYDDLLSVNSLNNYEDAFGHLVKQLDVSEAGVDALIDRLIELGYIIDSVDVQNKENIFKALGLDKIASSAEAARRNMTANDVYNSLTDKQRVLLGDNLNLISPESYNWTELQWLDFIKELQKKADDNQLEIPTSLDTAGALKSATDAFSKLGDSENGLYADILAGKSIDSSDIFALQDDFGNIDGGRALENFADTLLKFPGDTEKAQEALNNLITSYIDESGILDDLNEENKDYIKQELEKINVTNAEEVVEDRLNNSVRKNIKAFKEFSPVLSKHLDTLKNASPETDEFKNALETVKTSFEDFLKTNLGDGEFELSLSDDFIIQNLEDIEAAVLGSEEALNRIRIAASKDIASNISLNVPSQAYDGVLNQINSWIDNTDISTIKVGTYLDELPLVQGLQDLVDKGAIAQEDMNNILAGIGATPEITPEPVPVTLPNGVIGGVVGLAKTVFNIPRIRYKMSSNGAKGNYSPSSGGSGGGTSKAEVSKTQIDWISRHLEQLQKTIDKTKAKFENLNQPIKVT